MLRVDSIRERLLKLEEAASGLERIAAGRKVGSETDFRDDWAAERGLQVGAEAVFYVGNHILSSHFGVSPRDYEDIIALLGAHGVIPTAVLDPLRGLGGFRNILVPGYLSIDRVRVARYAEQAPSEFRAFAGAIRAWLERLGDPSR